MRVTFSFVAAAVLLSGCSSVFDPCSDKKLREANLNFLSAERAPVGATMEEVNQFVGRAPLGVGKYEMKDGRIIEVATYPGLGSPCFPIEPETVQAVFMDGRLYGSGPEFYNTLIAPEIKGPYVPPPPENMPTTIDIFPQRGPGAMLPYSPYAVNPQLQMMQQPMIMPMVMMPYSPMPAGQPMQMMAPMSPYPMPMGQPMMMQPQPSMGPSWSSSTLDVMEGVEVFPPAEGY